VGGSLFYLARRLPRVQSFTGISLSPVQITHARRRVPAGLMGRVRFEEGCFSGLPAGRIEAEAAYAIEALAHASEPEDFFRVQARVLPPRGRLIVIDDCLREDPPAVAIPERQRRLLDCYQRNWLLPGLRSPSALEAVAGPSGFRLITNIDLTPWLRLKRPRDRLISLCVKWFGPLMERNTYFQSLVGGDAKQRCYAVGLTHYRLLVFERCAPPA
jgi:SAM-dependent methyltransferase